MPFQLFSGLCVTAVGTQFDCTRSVSQTFCTRSLALNTIKAEVSLAFVQPPHQLPLCLLLTHTRVSEARAVITGLQTILSELISVFKLRNAEYDALCGMYCYIK